LLKETPHQLLERAEEVVIWWGKIRRVGWMWKNLPIEFLNGHLRHVCSVWSGVIILVKPLGTRHCVWLGFAFTATWLIEFCLCKVMVVHELELPDYVTRILFCNCLLVELWIHSCCS
jgi:hypothetical protein